MNTGTLLTCLLGGAVLAPLASFVLILLVGRFMGKHGKQAGLLATVMIATSCVLSFCALGVWLSAHAPAAVAHHDDHGDGHGHGNDDEHVRLDDRQPSTTNPPTNPLSVAPQQDTAPQHDTLLVADDESAEHDEAGAHDHGSEEHESEEQHGASGHDDQHSHSDHGHASGPSYSQEIYTLAKFYDAKISISAYIDALTVCMFAMVTLIATCIHFYAMGYMHDELVEDYVDHEAYMADGSHVHRPGRFHRFFQALSLFCFSMLGLVLSGNIAMTFVFWELVGICSYFLIGFYIERHSASTAANKAFIVNRVGDFGMIIGLMALWGSLGTFTFGGDDGLFAAVRPANLEHQQIVPDGMVKAAAGDEMAALVRSLPADANLDEAASEKVGEWREAMEPGEPGHAGRWLLIVAGVGIFCGCVGKSAQFPLHVWLPDAMEGPTPVSALVHSATMVAAGVFLVARFFPVFTPEVLFVIAIAGTITLFMAATIAIVATDIKRVLAYSTVSQLGYMMLALGVGGWLAGVMHLFTHAFFKSLLFMCSGSVIHAVHTNEMPEMGGLRKKMPWTAYTMLIGCLAIAGAGLPFALTIGGEKYGLGFSGYYSKDAILEQALLFRNVNPGWGTFFFFAAAGGAAITAFYMFRLWYLTFAGEPRNQERYDHAHESPPVMYRPLILLATLAVAVAWRPVEGLIGAAIAAVIFMVLKLKSGSATTDDHGHSEHAHAAHGHAADGAGDHAHDDHAHGATPGWSPLTVAFGISVLVFAVSMVWMPFSHVSLSSLLEQARPAGTLEVGPAAFMQMTWPNEHDSHAPAIKVPATWIAFSTAMAGFLLSTVFYGLRKLDAEESRRAFAPVHKFLLNKWWFDELYDFLFIKPSHVISAWISKLDQVLIDGILNGLAWATRTFAGVWERLADRTIVDGFVNLIGRRTYAAGVSLRQAQTGSLRQYVMFIVMGTVILFALASFIRHAMAF